jgi:hypothetical protein
LAPQQEINPNFSRRQVALAVLADLGLGPTH